MNWIEKYISPEKSGDYIVTDGKGNYEVAYYSKLLDRFSFSKDEYDENFIVVAWSDFEYYLEK